MIFLELLLLLLASSHSVSSVADPQVIFAQIGNSVTLPRKKWGDDRKVHVRWSFNDIPLISRNPTNPSVKPESTDWQGRISLSEDFSLIISQVNTSDFENFKCEQYELMDHFVTTYKLYRVWIPSPSPLLVNASLSLSCEIDQKGFELARPSVKWLGPDDVPYSGTQIRNKNTLSVTKVSEKHGGKWTCVVDNSIGGILKAKTEVTIVDLSPSLPDPIYTHDFYQNLNIPCSFSSKISWSTVTGVGMKGGSWSFSPLNRPESSLTLLNLHLNPSPAWKSHTDTQSSLMEGEIKDHVLDVKLSRVSVNNRGTYTCNLEFGSGTIRRNVQVEVLQVISSAGKDIYEGYPLNLTCTLGHPMNSDLEVNWIPPRGSSLQTHQMQMSIPEVSLKDSGRWTCQLKKNATVLTSATFILKVEKSSANFWMTIAIAVGVLVVLLIIGMIVFFIRRQREPTCKRRKRRYCRCKNPQAKGFYKT